MKAKTIFIVCILLFITLGSAFAQQAADPGAAATTTAVATAQQLLREISVDKFEDAGLWTAHISIDNGVATSRLFEGGPTEVNGKQRIDQEPDGSVFGVRVDYFSRGNTTITVSPTHPLPIPGVTKTISVWVAGRNYNHTLYAHLEGITGKRFSLPMGTLNFSGWRQLSVSVPSTVEQINRHYSNKQGLQFIGFSIDPDILETTGSYYVYFDDLRAWTDLFSQSSVNPNDLPDNW